MTSSFPLVSFLITLMLAAPLCTHGDQKHVLDTAGNPVLTTAKYLIQPLSGSNGGGLLPVPVKLLPLCPLGISQSLVRALPGLPVSFSYPYAFMDNHVNEMEAVNIEFKSDTWPGCYEFSKFWEVDGSSSAASEEPAILVGGKKHEKNSWFRVERKVPFHGGVVYKLNALTGTIGTVPGHWEKAPQLVVTNDTAKTFFVKFHRVDDDDATATTSTSRLEKLGLRMFPFY